MNNQEANMKTIEQIANNLGFKLKDHPEVDAKYFMLEPHDLTAIFEAWNRQNSEPVFIVEPDYHDQAMGCGLEDRNITDRYEAMAYGWNEGIKRMFEQLPDEPLYLAPQQPQSVKDALEKAAKMIKTAIEFNKEAEGFISESEYELNSYLGERAAELFVNAPPLLAEIRALIDQPQPPASQELEAIVNINKTVDRFLSWKLPSDFYPDCGISFEQYSNPDNDRYKALREPIGTNLFTATQAKEMFEQCLVYENDFNLDYTCKRIRRLLNAMGMSDPSNGKDTVLMGCLFSLLGTICNKLEQSKPAKG